MSRKRTRRMTNADTAGKKMPPFWRDGTGDCERWPTVRGRFVSEERARDERGYDERGYVRRYNPNAIF